MIDITQIINQHGNGALIKVKLLCKCGHKFEAEVPSQLFELSTVLDEVRCPSCDGDRLYLRLTDG